MGFFQNMFGKKAGDKAQINTEEAVNVKELAAENTAQTKEDLGGLAEQAERGKEILRSNEINNALATSTAEQYDLVYKFNYANYLANKTGKTSAQCFTAINNVAAKKELLNNAA